MDFVLDMMGPPPKDGKAFVRWLALWEKLREAQTEARIEEAAKALQWARDIDPNDKNEYRWNLLVACLQDSGDSPNSLRA